MTSLSKAERRIADVIVDNPEAIINTTTALLARQANVSDPTISRFCKSLGCNGFPDFKVRLAKSLATKRSFITEQVSADDDTASFIEKRINANQAALEYLRTQIDTDSIQAAIKKLTAAKRIEIYGIGGSAAIAQDAQHKLFRLGIPTIAYEDQMMQRMSAAAADKNTVVIMISFTGRTQSFVDIAKIAQQSGATVLAITHLGSPLAMHANISIASGDELEDTTIYVPMTTRIIILTIIDVLATGMALALGSDAERKLKRIKHSLDDTRIDLDT